MQENGELCKSLEEQAELTEKRREITAILYNSRVTKVDHA